MKKYYLQDILLGIHCKHHWTAKVAQIFVDFYLNHWKWVWGTIFMSFSGRTLILNKFECSEEQVYYCYDKILGRN